MYYRNSSGTSFHVFHSLRPKSVRIFAAQFCITSRSHFTPLTVKNFTEPLFNLLSMITLVSLVNSTAQSQFHTRTRCPDTCRQLRFPSILILYQEEATREPRLQLLRFLPIQLLMLMSLLQLHATIFSTLIATPDSTECMLEVVSFSELSVFLDLLVEYVLQGPPQDQ